MPAQRGIRFYSRPEASGNWPVIILLLAAALFVASCSNQRVALVVGNSAYTGPLPYLNNPVNDAEAIAKALQRLGFQVMLRTDLDRASMELTIQSFVAAAKGADVVLFFYAGHGFQIDGENYLVPIDIYRNLVAGSISFGKITSALEETSADNTIIFIDACRRNPLRDSSVRDGLAEVNARYGTLIVFAAAPGHVAYDGKGRNSPFTKALLRHIEAPNVGVQAMLTEVRTDVMGDTNDQQVPWDQSSLTGVFYFKRESPILSW